MSNIEQNLAFILSSRYGKDVRQAIHDAIHDCYEDGKAGSIDLVAREQIANLVATVPEGTEKDSELVDARVDFEGVTYPSLGEHIRDIGKYVGKQRKITFRVDYPNIGMYVGKSATGINFGNMAMRASNFIPVKGFKKLIYRNYYEQPFISHVAFFETIGHDSVPVYAVPNGYTESSILNEGIAIETDIPSNANYVVFSIQYDNVYETKTLHNYPIAELYPADDQIAERKKVEILLKKSEEFLTNGGTSVSYRHSSSTFTGWLSFYNEKNIDLLFDEIIVPFEIWSDNVTITKLRIIIGIGKRSYYEPQDPNKRNVAVASGVMFDEIIDIGPYSKKKEYEERIKLPYSIYIPKGKSFFFGAFADDICGFGFSNERSENSVSVYTTSTDPSSITIVPGNLQVGSFNTLGVQIVNLASNNQELSTKSPRIILPNKINAVVGDELQLFYRGFIEHPYPYIYNIEIICDVGRQRPRYFQLTPTLSDVGEHDLTVNVRDMDDAIIATAETVLDIVDVGNSPSSIKNILCVGDSLTAGGYWPEEFLRRLTGTGGTPSGNNLTNIRFIGTKEKGNAKYEGYGGWSWNAYNIAPSTTTLGMIAYCSHDKDITDQHSIWQDSSGARWSLETIEDNSLTFTRYENQTSPMPIGSGVLSHVSGGSHASAINYTETAYADGNPFWDASEGKVDFSSYCDRNGFSGIDYVYTLLSWNGLNSYWDTPDQLYSILKQAKIFLRNVHAGFPSAKIKLCGIPLPSVNGGTGTSYGANSVYSNWYGLIRTVMGLNSAYQELANDDEFSSYVEFINISSQFDAENNMPESFEPVNTRNLSKTEYIGSNGVHPTLEGYLQIADAVYRNAVANLTQ